MSKIDVIVVGGGIAGLSTARELALRGLRPVVLERDRTGSHASTAAAGILVSRGAVRSRTPGRTFYLRSLQEYRAWVEGLSEASDTALRLEEGDDWCFFPHGAGADRFRARLEEESDPSRWTETDSVPPALATGFRPDRFRAFRIAGERWTDPAPLLLALRQAAIAAGARIDEGCGRVELFRDGRRWGARTMDRTYLADSAVAAAGPWTDSVLAGLGWSAVLVPVRGQLALVPALHGLKSMVHLEDTFYAVPRDGWTVVGATMEHGTLEESVTADGLAALQDRMRSIFPGLDLSRAGRTWSGIRPRTRDRVPHVGRLEPGLFVASGHFRSGISMAPRTGRIVADLLAGLPLDADAVELDPLRPGGWSRSGMSRL